VAVRGLGESFAGPRSLPTMMTHPRAMHLLEGVAARPLPLWSCWPVVEFPLGCCLCKGSLLAWTWPWSLRCNRRQGYPNLVQAGTSASHVLLSLLFCSLVCALRGCVVALGVYPSRLMASLIQIRSHFEPFV
jgi:hypothetical protein